MALVEKSLLRFIWGWVRPYLWLALLGLLLTIPVGALDAAVAAFIRPFIDRVILGRDPSFSAHIPLFIVLFAAIQGLFTFSSAYVNARVGNRITFDVKEKLFRRLLLLDADYFDHADSGTVLLRFSTDAETACAGLVANIRFFLTRLFSSLSLAAVLIYNSPQLAAIALSAVIFALYPLRLVRKKMRNLTTRNQFSGATAMQFYGECCSGNRTIAAYNLQKNWMDRYTHLINDMFRVSMRIARHANWPSPAMHFIVSAALALVLGLGGWLVLNGHMGGGSFASFIAALLLLYTPIKGIGNNLTAIQGAILAAERIRETLHWEPKIPNIVQENPVPLPVSRGIRFENVSFSYSPDRIALDGVSFTIPAGRSVGIVGGSGGGKTTLIHLLLRLYDVSGGRITVDDEDLRSIPLGRLRRSIAIVFQDNFLFSGTIRQNIQWGNPQAPEKALRAAVEAALLEEFLATLPMGLDTEVGERGSLLSGGQRQRVAIARAILRDAPIVVLDEATSALDNSSEALVQGALENLMRGRTVLTIAHRLSTVSRADSILVLEGGRLVEAGTPEDLLRNPNGAYARLQAQGGGSNQ